MDGVSTVEVSLSEKNVSVDFDSDKTTIEQIKEVIDDQGYEAK